jgi:hypothetical protein
MPRQCPAILSRWNPNSECWHHFDEELARRFELDRAEREERHLDTLQAYRPSTLPDDAPDELHWSMFGVV